MITKHSDYFAKWFDLVKAAKKSKEERFKR